VLGRLAPTKYPEEVLVAGETGDDAAVYRLPDGTGLVQTVDFFTPIVDDARDWGRVAAANAFSDVYAMGGRPVLALNVVGWPVDALSLDLLAEVLEGGGAMASEAAVAVVGGHTIDDREPKYGMAVTGFVDPGRMLRNSTAPPHARLLLTKPLGIGIITTAIKRERASDEQVAVVLDTMTTLNKDAAEAAVEAGVEAATDVTGFGLLGHLHHLLLASGVSAEVDAGAMPLLAGTMELAADGVVPGGTRRNLDYVTPKVDWGGLNREERLILADAQTSGGLLLVAAGERADRVTDALRDRNVTAWDIGRTEPGPAGAIRVAGRIPPP
jgi:selenide,water dikinase